MGSLSGTTSDASVIVAWPSRARALVGHVDAQTMNAVASLPDRTPFAIVSAGPGYA